MAIVAASVGEAHRGVKRTSMRLVLLVAVGGLLWPRRLTNR
jgi:hypothetical protein